MPAQFAACLGTHRSAVVLHRSSNSFAAWRQGPLVTCLHASRRRQYFCSTTVASTRRARAAARVAAFLPASVVRLKRRRVSHMRTQLWMMVALRCLQSGSR